MRILVIPPVPTFDYGARSYLLSKHLTELGDEVHLVMWDPYPTDFSNIKKNITSSLKYVTYVKDGVVVHKIRRLPFFFPPINGYLFRRFVSRLSVGEGLEIIIASSFFNEVQPPFDLPSIYDLVDNYEAHVDLHAGRIERLALKYILRLRKSVHTQIRRAAAVTTVSDILMDYVRRIAPEVGVHKIINGVDSLFLDAPFERPESAFGRYSMAYVSYFGKYANLPKLIEATGLLKKAHPEVKLVLVGRGPTIREAKKLVGRLGLSEQVIFVGQVEREKVMEIVNGCRITLSPCKKNLVRDSALPMKIMEYTALGKMVVSSDLEEVKSISLPNVVVFDEGKGIEELADAIETAFNTEVDQDETRRLASKYTWTSIAQRFHCIAEEVIARSSI